VAAKDVAVMQLHDHESYFILPAEKQPAARSPRTPLMTGVLVLVTILIMALVALAMGMCWDSLTPIR
jgi:hypothetical protein